MYMVENGVASTGRCYRDMDGPYIDDIIVAAYFLHK